MSSFSCQTICGTKYRSFSNLSNIVYTNQDSLNRYPWFVEFVVHLSYVGGIQVVDRIKMVDITNVKELEMQSMF